jgi:pimeloyl-ACP methyl ester carboxylesterase
VEPDHVAPPPLLLLHGGGADARSWGPIIDRLSDFPRIEAVNLPGHGGEPGFHYDADVVSKMADLVSERTRQLVRPHVIGHSMGGAVALELARCMPVSAVTAFCPIGFWTRTHAWYTAALLRTAARVSTVARPSARRLLSGSTARTLALSAFSAHPSSISPGAAAAAAAALAGSEIAAMTKYTWRYSFTDPATITCPVLLVWATRDRLVPLADATRARRLLPQAVHALIPGSGHLVMQDDPDLTAAIVREHANRLPPADFTDG